MSYNKVSKSRFYVNLVENLYNGGHVSSIDPIYLSSHWHNSKSYSLETACEVYLNHEGLIKDFNYIIILGHKNLLIKSIPFAEGYWSVVSNLESVEEGYVPTYDYVPIILEASYEGFIGGNDVQFGFTFDKRDSAQDNFYLSGVSFGNYYDLPYSADLGLKKIISYDNTKTYDNISGKTLSSNYGSSKTFNPFVNIYEDINNQVTYFGLNDGSNADYYSLIASNEQNYISTGRRSYELSYSHLGESPVGQNHAFPRDFNYVPDSLSMSLPNNDGIMEYTSDKNNFYSTVINKTMGTHIPFIFATDSSNPNEMMLARFISNKFEFTESAPNLHDISFGIREVW